MGDTDQSEDVHLRPATQADAQTIKEIISSVHINPMSLHWQRFTLAVDQEGRVIGCGQIKLHGDGSYELASIAVLPEWRGKGIARVIIEHLLKEHPGRLYLTCRAELEPLYQKFGFQNIGGGDLTPYFKRLSRLASFFSWLFRRPDRMLVMRKG